MVQEFEGRTEKEAIDRAIAELNLERGEFDVEVLESPKKGILFRKGGVRIRVHAHGGDVIGPQVAGQPDVVAEADEPNGNVLVEEDVEIDDQIGNRLPESVHAEGGFPATGSGPIITPTENEVKIIQFLSEVIRLMGYSATVTLVRREERKVLLSISSRHSGILIGRKGKNLDSLQLLANVYAGRFSPSLKVVVDAENYRARREETLVRLAEKTAEQVRRSRSSRLLEPMNPFERRLVHTALNNLGDIETKSEGEGLYKQIRVFYKGGA